MPRFDHFFKSRNIKFIDGSNELFASVQYLTLKSDLTITCSFLEQSVGSSWVESIMLDKPSLAFSPIKSRLTTPLIKQFDNLFIFSTLETLEAEMVRVLSTKWHTKSKKTLKRYFDPFEDRKALNRMRKIVKEVISRPEAIHGFKKISNLKEVLSV